MRVTDRINEPGVDGLLDLLEEKDQMIFELHGEIVDLKEKLEDLVEEVE